TTGSKLPPPLLLPPVAAAIPAIATTITPITIAAFAEVERRPHQLLAASGPSESRPRARARFRARSSSVGRYSAPFGPPPIPCLPQSPSRLVPRHIALLPPLRTLTVRAGPHGALAHRPRLPCRFTDSPVAACSSIFWASSSWYCPGGVFMK